MYSSRLLHIKDYLNLSRNILTQSAHKSNRCLNPFMLINYQHVHYCSKPDESLNKRQRSMPTLMKYPKIVWPSFINSLRNWLLVNCIIRPYFDNDFNLKDFIFGAKQAVHVISSKLVNSNFIDLTNLVSLEALEEIRPIIEKMTVFQRKQLEINKDDIFLSFPYQVGIMFDETNKNTQKRFVEITMVFHVFKGFREMQSQGEVLPWNMGSMPEYEDKVFVCNYRFIKEFTIGNETDWTVNVINHFKPKDLIFDED